MKNIITIVGLLLILALGYYLFVVEESSVLQQTTLVTSQADQELSALLRQLDEIKQIQFDRSILSDPLFTNRREEIYPPIIIDVGRPDPFSSVGFTSN